MSYDRASAMSRAFEFIVKSEVRGDYFEFGCYEGKSLVNAYKASIKWECIGRNAGSEKKSRFYVFDSFKGLPPLGQEDRLQDYDVLGEGQYSCSLGQLKARLESERIDLSRFTFIPGFYHDSLAHPATKETVEGNSAAIVHVDCDLYSSTIEVLRFIDNFLADGSLILFDDWYLFRGRKDRGVQRAYYEWLERTSWEPHEYFKYSWSGVCFIVNNRN